MGGYPSHPVECRQGGKQISREPVIEKHAKCGNVEELVPGDCPPIDILLWFRFYQSSVHCDKWQNSWPECLDRVDAKSSEISRESHTHQLDEQGQHQLIAKSDEALAVEHWRLLDQDHSVTIGGVDCNVVSDRREHLLLEGPRPRIQRVTSTSDRKPPVR